MVTRRTSLAIAGIFPLFALAAEDSDVARNPSYADVDAADNWMSRWMHARAGERGAEGMLYVGRFADPYYFTLDEILWTPEGDQIGRFQQVRVPIGFVTDFASIPRVFWSLLRPDGEYSYAAVIHDFLYWEQSCDRISADEIFKFCMEEFKIGSTTVESIYAAVRIGGESAWQENAKAKALGKRRVLKRTPKDPKIRWEQWQSMPEVF
jgi:hypothetical protein